MTIAIPIVVGVALFFIAAALIEYLRPKLRSRPISSGLTGRYHLYLDVGFAAMALAFFWGAYITTGIVSIVAVVVAIGVLGAMGSRSFWWGAQYANHLHIASSATAFIGALIFEFLLSARIHYLWPLAIAYPLIVFAVWWKARLDTPLQEKTAALMICLFLLVWGL